MGSWLWRIGLARQIYALHVDIARVLSKVFREKAKSSEASLIEYFRTQQQFDARRNANGLRPSWQVYCSDPRFAEFADGYMLENDDDESLSWFRNGSLPNSCRRCSTLRGIFQPIPVVHENTSIINVKIPLNHSGFFPACEGTVDLTQPLPSCTRIRSSQRIHVSHGRGRPFAVMCEHFDPIRGYGDAVCEPLPNVSYVTNGLLTPATVFARHSRT